MAFSYLHTYNHKISVWNTSSILIISLLILNIIPLGAIPRTGYAPLNYLFVFICLFILINFNRIIQRTNKHFRYIFIIILVYTLLSALFNYYKYDELENILPKYRIFLTLLLFCSISSKAIYYKLLKVFAIVLFISTFYGILIYYIGEPFASFRMILLGDIEQVTYVGKGDRVVGFSNKIFHFAYLLSILPILLLTFYKIEKKVSSYF